MFGKSFQGVDGIFTARGEMASIDEAYLDMTGTARLHGPRYVPRTNCTSG